MQAIEAKRFCNVAGVILPEASREALDRSREALTRCANPEARLGKWQRLASFFGKERQSLWRVLCPDRRHSVLVQDKDGKPTKILWEKMAMDDDSAFVYDSFVEVVEESVFFNVLDWLD